MDKVAKPKKHTARPGSAREAEASADRLVNAMSCVFVNSIVETPHAKRCRYSRRARFGTGHYQR